MEENMIVFAIGVVVLLVWAFYTGHLAGFKSKVQADVKVLNAGIAARLAAAKPDVALPVRVATPASVATTLATAAQTTDSSIFAAFARGVAKSKGVTK
jgi:hypothetical protein